MRLTRFLLSLGVVAATALFATAQNKRLLLVTHSGGFMHDSIGVAEDILKEQGPKNGYDVTCYRFTEDPNKKVKYKPKKDGPEVETTALEKYSADYRARTGKTVEKENCGHINKETLKNFDAVLFFTTGNPTTKDELKDLEEWTKAGGAFAGTHCGADTLYNTTYGDFIGGYFKTHPPITKVKIKFEDSKHPAAVGFTAGQQYEDEIYIFREPYSRDKLHIIFSCESGSFNPKPDQARKDGDYALSWCKEEGKGKVFYTAFGHKKEVWKDPAFQQHLFGGLNWAVGKVPGDATPTGPAK
ncbi:ThuA domain-containing protein [Limnoglobus roseus]|uniref:ThuA domain-containing protein n=1 Tax=Limnoglobus roseus TaxID=2598579 RepID=A0A5C1AD49_9BACT|nr:ThuA domain-containing protein [Limnoglobus roseus]QEL15926.1 ThuA domain-containing protein [Limnoglobus roseus]